MAGTGPAGGERRSRPRDEARRAASMQKLTDDGELLGADLPPGVLAEGEQWHERTVAWWDTWRTAPQAKMFLTTDWDFLLDTALMHHTMWSRGRLELASEIRLRAAKFGATVEDRMRLRMKVETPAPDTNKPNAAPEQASVTSIASRRQRLSG